MIPSPFHPSSEAIDAVIFDAAGVLVLPNVELGRSALRTLGFESRPEDWHRAYYSAIVVLDRMEMPDWPVVHRAFAYAVGVSSDQLDAAAPLIKELITGTPWVAIDGAANVLWSLSYAGYRLGVISNGVGRTAQELEETGICSDTKEGLPRVGVIIDSHLVGVSKPDPRIFQLALEALGVEPARSLYVGDTVRFDVIGASAAGLHPIHMDPYDFCTGDHSHISDLAELTDWLVRGSKDPSTE